MTRELESALNPQLEANRLNAVRNLAGYLKTPAESILREHQEDVMDSLYQFLRAGGTSGYISLPSGSGKTILAAEIARVLGGKTLIISPTQTILTQTDKAITTFTPQVDATRYFAEEKDLRGQVVNTTYQSLLTLLSSKTFRPADFSLLILDEAHLGLGEQRHKIYREFPQALKIGLTATPYFTPLTGYRDRGLVKPGEAWTDLFTRCIHEMTLEEAIERGILVHVALYLLRTNVEVPRLKLIRNQNYDKGEIMRHLNTEYRNTLTLGMVAGPDRIPKSVRLPREQREEVESINRAIAGKRTAIFGLSIAHIEGLTEALGRLGIGAAAVHGRVPYEKRVEIFRKHTEGEIPVILGVDALRVGWDSPPTEVGFYLEPHRSGILAVQELGRVLRPHPEKKMAIAIQLIDDFRDRAQTPVLFADIFNPETILRGSQTGRQPVRGVTSEKGSFPPIELRGTNLTAILESARSQALIQTRFKQATIAETAQILNNLAQEIQGAHPHLSTFELYRRIADTLPQKVASEKQRQALQAIASLDTNTAQKGRDVFVLLNLKSLLSGVEPYLGEDREENEEILCAATAAVMENLTDIKPYEQPTQRVYELAQFGAQRYIASRDNVPWIWVREGRDAEVKAAVEQALSAYPKGMSKETIRILAEELSQKTGVSAWSLARYLCLRNFLWRYEQMDEDDLLDEAIKEGLRGEIAAAMINLKPKYQRVLALRFGLEDGQPRTLQEVGLILGLSGETIRNIQDRALRHLRHPLRSRRWK